MWGANEVLSERVLFTWAQPCQGPHCLSHESGKAFSGEAQEDGKAFLWSKYKC